MRRGLILCAAALAGTATVAGAVSAASSVHAHLRGFECKRALDPSGRVVSVRAVMRPVSGTRHMTMRFELLSKAAGGPETEVTGGDLDTWITPADAKLGQRPGDVWIVNRPVSDLAGPARYHFRVSFRWVGTHARVLGAAVRVGPTCYEPELRPDLLVVSITVQPISGQPNSERYTVMIGNRGRTAAGPFQVWFSYGQIVEKQSVTGLGANNRLKETFTGPVCTSTTAPTVTVDPTHQVDDANASNNAMTANCSGSTGS